VCDVKALYDFRRRIIEWLLLMVDGTFFSSGSFAQLITVLLEMKTDVGTTKKVLVYAVYCMSREKREYYEAFAVIYKHMCATLGIKINRVFLQCDAESGLYMGIEEAFKDLGCRVITTLCGVHLMRSNWFQLRRHLSIRVATSEARICLYYLQALVCHNRLVFLNNCSHMFDWI
jgi:hypothetical protein